LSIQDLASESQVEFIDIRLNEMRWLVSIDLNILCADREKSAICCCDAIKIVCGALPQSNTKLHVANDKLACINH
jgi:hypothetical protein